MTTMTTGAGARFSELVNMIASDEELERQLAAIKPGDRKALLTLAASRGHAFTAAELEEASQEARRLVARDSGELPEGALERVSGGTSPLVAQRGQPPAPPGVVIAIIAVLIG
jgi:hypothetical protein